MRRAAILISLGVLAAACGGGGGGGGNNGGSDQSPPASPSPTSGGSAANCTDESSGPVFKLVQQNTAFDPKCLKVKSAQAIRIDNKDSVLHNFTVPNTQVNVDIQPGTTFNGESAGLAPGTYQFFCRFHKNSGMTGTLVVTS